MVIINVSYITYIGLLKIVIGDLVFSLLIFPLPWMWYFFSGMPIGLQIMGKPWGEAALLHAGSVLEAVLGPKMKLPQVHFDVLYGQQMS